MPGQIVGVVNTTDYWLGFLGLGMGVTNFTGTSESPFLSIAADNKSFIPSRSYGYTSGAYYRESG